MRLKPATLVHLMCVALLLISSLAVTTAYISGEQPAAAADDTWRIAAAAAEGSRSPTVRTQRQESSIDHFMRVRRDRRKKPVAFETSITRYLGTNEQDESIFVDLIGVVHIGEEDYYRDINDRFQEYDAVLYELVAPSDMQVPRADDRSREEGLNPIAALQVGMQTALGLEFQLEHIDYEQDNLVHADMSPDEFLASMRDNDESFSKIFLKAMGQSMAQSGRSTSTNLDLLRVLFAKDKEIRMRQLFAVEMMNMEGGLSIFEGKDGSTIINHRNGKAMEVLQREIDNGRKRLAIFYGAGHLPDMEERLIDDFNMKRGGQFWLPAWKLRR